MRLPARSALGCALALATLAAAGNAAGARAQAAPSAQVLMLPAELSNVCEADAQALQLAMARQWRPSLNALDQWTQLVRSFSCDLSGQRDLGWHRVPLRAYESAIRYPLTWVETETHNGRTRRKVKTYYSAAQLPPKIDFWVGGRIDEIRYDKRLRRIDARFPAAGSRGGSNGAASAAAAAAAAQCAYTTLQFRQQNGLWLLSGVEPNLSPRC
ncbi:hypothetical protein [Cupriavidus neocaledonicus]|uniref:Uncharacterized protein n=1 Tax=Cupriavidus neocaledonicus TaxID=1040979 RepID=A0A375H1N3_9BURK|nr:hypothetical protein [Cupriavidus neocaledonicus]SOZ36997.1 conserved hypothetical protein; putative exported protein [Cupriavidus neocaledonicus]SPD45572.1 conserved exported protein of unknown function [Cupriavidus neocaledonicus]